jgi:acyl-CoA thioesterase YciA
MSLMDMVGKLSATTVADGRVVTVAVDRIVFREPVKVGDVVCCYTETLRVGRSSVILSIEVWALRQDQGEQVKVTEAVFTFVAVDDDGRPPPVAVEAASSNS